jgi:hypothetical protein
MSKEYVLVYNIGHINHPNYVKPEDLGDKIRCDGIYKSVWEYRDLLKGRDVILCIVGNLVGKDNTFDLANVPKLEYFCDWNQIMELVNQGAKLGWHTWNHKNLTTLSDDEIIKEITPPFPMDYLACPYEQINQRIIDLAKSIGFINIV